MNMRLDVFIVAPPGLPRKPRESYGRCCRPGQPRRAQRRKIRLPKRQNRANARRWNLSPLARIVPNWQIPGKPGSILRGIPRGKCRFLRQARLRSRFGLGARPGNRPAQWTCGEAESTSGSNGRRCGRHGAGKERIEKMPPDGRFYSTRWPDRPKSACENSSRRCIKPCRCSSTQE